MLMFFYFSHSPYLQFPKSVPSKCMFTKNDKVNCTILKQISATEIIFKRVYQRHDAIFYTFSFE